MTQMGVPDQAQFFEQLQRAVDRRRVDGGNRVADLLRRGVAEGAHRGEHLLALGGDAQPAGAQFGGEVGHAAMVGSLCAVPVALLAVLGRGVIDPHAPVLAADDEGFTRGDGCFEGCRVVDGAVDKLDAHVQRMARSAAALGLPFDAAQWQEFVRSSLEHWGRPGEAALKLVLSRGPAGGEPVGLLTVSPLPADYPRQRREGIAVITLTRGTASDAYAAAPWLLGGVKTLSYAVNMAAQREARRRGADDVIFLSADGRVLEAPTSSLVWTDSAAGPSEDGRMALCTTPTQGTGILAGTTQELLFARAAAAGWRCSAHLGTVAELLAAEGCWLVGTVRGPVEVVSVDGTGRVRNPGATARIRALCGF